MRCEVCQSPLCSVHGGLYHRGDESHEDFYKQSRCCEHGGRHCCPCQSCHGDQGACLTPEKAKEIKECEGYGSCLHDFVEKASWSLDATRFDKDTVKQILRDFKAKRVKDPKGQRDAGASFEMYVRLNLLLKRGKFASLNSIVKEVPRCLHVSKQKLRVVKAVLDDPHVDLGNLAIPPEVQMGRWGKGTLSPSQMKDVFTSVQEGQHSNRPVQKGELEKMICGYRLFNRAGGNLTGAEAASLAGCSFYRAAHTRSGTWKAFQTQANNMLPGKSALNLRKRVKGVPRWQSQCCTPESVALQLNELMQIFVELKICSGPEGKIDESEAWRVWSVDEKGFDERKLSGCNAVVFGKGSAGASGVPGRQRTVITAVPGGGFKHISGCSWISLSGETCHPSAVVCGKSVASYLPKLFAGGHVLATKNGSMTGRLFWECFQWWLTQLEKKHGPAAKTEWKCVVMDSGGGSLPMHLKAGEEGFCDWLLENKIRLYILQSNHTHALMPNDMVGMPSFPSSGGDGAQSMLKSV